MKDALSQSRVFIIRATWLVLCVLGTSAIVSQLAGAQETAPAKKTVEYLFVQNAHAMTSHGDTITLHGVSPVTLSTTLKILYGSVR